MNKDRKIAVYKILVQYLKRGLKVLDDSVREEIMTFIKSQQDKNGGFKDRAGNQDLYYSLFGLWLGMATGQEDLLQQLKEYTLKTKGTKNGSPVEELALLLLKSELCPEIESPSIYSIIRIVFKKGNSIDLSYQFFLITLVIDAVGKNTRLFYLIARIWLSFYKTKDNLPSSILAALLFGKKTLSLNYKTEEKELLEYLNKEGGFKAFKTGKTSDTLSSGVALFVLQEVDHDMRFIAPACLDFVQDCYSKGAFLSGDGDQTRDLEYTFYGLLALGSVVDYEE